MLQGALDRVALHVARLGEGRRGALHDLQGHLGLAQGLLEIVTRQGHVHDGRALAVEHRGHAAIAAKSARSALAEVGARLRVKAHVHGSSSSGVRSRSAATTGGRFGHAATSITVSGRRGSPGTLAEERGEPTRWLRGHRHLLVHLEHARDRPVGEHLVDGLGEERGDRQDGELVELVLQGNRQSVGDDDLADA